MASASATGAASLESGKPVRAYAGCAVWRGQCTCHDDGRRVKVEPEIGSSETEFGDVKKQAYQVAALVDARGFPVPPALPSEAKLDAMA
ncbi:hypothetical protein [Ramlibacter sp. 2FC]|uniref:hypothetical protein n=1 Tax=Ramlibacter sp. 2FC TaxID=2502188 RepID=UPI0010F55BE8|nr:hypothetical protein [Ramlibacter sp. 2FC]